MPKTLTRYRADELEDVVDLMKAEYNEMPGLSLTPSQARRLWNLEDTTAAQALARLLDTGFLRRTTTGGYARAER